MGKKKSGNGGSNGAGADEPKATAFVLKVPTHCRCDGCSDKIRAAVKDLTLRCDGILSLDQSALSSRGELAVVATADPEKLRRRLRKATGKDVGLVFPKPPPAAARADGTGGGKDAAATAAAVQALLASLQQPQAAALAHHGQPVPAAAAWNALQQGGMYGQAAYPWLAQQQAPALEPYLASYPAAAYPAASWGAYAAYPHDGLGGAYGGGGGSWVGY